MTAAAKARLRNEARERRRIAWQKCGGRAAASLCERFLDAMPAIELSLGPDTPVRVVSGYWPVGEEMDIRLLLGELDRRRFLCALPVVVGKGRPLAFRRWRPGDRLYPAAFGLFEPGDDAPDVVPDVLVVPLLAFDGAGFRLGQGAGYYDRTLATLRASRRVLAIGVGFDDQEVAALPRDPHDQRLDWVITESRAVRFGEQRP